MRVARRCPCGSVCVCVHEWPHLLARWSKLPLWFVLFFQAYPASTQVGDVLIFDALNLQAVNILQVSIRTRACAAGLRVFACSLSCPAVVLPPVVSTNAPLLVRVPAACCPLCVVSVCRQRCAGAQDEAGPRELQLYGYDAGDILGEGHGDQVGPVLCALALRPLCLSRFVRVRANLLRRRPPVAWRTQGIFGACGDQATPVSARHVPGDDLLHEL